MGKLTDQQKIDVLRLYQEGYTCQSLSEQFGVVDESIRSLLKRRGIDRRTRKYVADESFFDEIDCEAKAYWLGFIFADGNVSGTTVAIALNEKDKSQLEAFCRAVNTDNPLEFRPSNNSWKAKVHSRHMVNTLKELGCVERKSKVIKVPDISEGLLHHFYRGHFDGDGWITYRMQSGKWKSWKTGVASQSFEFLNTLHRWVVRSNNREVGSLFQRGNGKCWTLDFSGKQSSLDFLNLLYDGASIFLARKMQKYLEIV